MNGQSQAEIARAIADAGATDLNRARFWARDQAGSFYGKVAKVQQKGAGFNGYIWRGLRDNKLRDSHSEMLDKYFDWDSPPLVGDRHLHPGEDYNCRCHAEPAMSPEDADQQTDPWGFPLPEGKTGTGKPEQAEQNKKRTGIGKDLEEKLPVDVQFDMKNKLDKASEPVKNLWYRHADDLRIIDGNSRGAFFSPFEEGIYVNIARDVLGAEDSKPHRGMFHEFGHNLDYLAVGKDRYGYLSSQFVSKRFAGLSFSDMLHKEAKEYEIQTKKRLQDKAARKGLSRKSVGIDYTRDVISKELYGIEEKERRAVSDIWSGVSNDNCSGGYHHQKKYWKDKTALPAEAFAHMTETSINNKKGLENIKKYFPKSYELYLEMIESIGDTK